MLDIFTKRIYAAVAETDGLRVLVDRLWPRGIAKEAAALDLWARDAAPSSELRVWFGHRRERFREFEHRYREELASGPVLDELLTFIVRSTTTLLFGAKDPLLNHAVVLADELKRHVGVTDAR